MRSGAYLTHVEVLPVFEHASVVFYGNDRDSDDLPVPFRNYGIYADTDPTTGDGRAWIVCFSEPAPGETASVPTIVPGGAKAAIAAALRTLDSHPANQTLNRKQFP